MIRSKSAAKLDGWTDIAKDSPVASFVNGVERDLIAVRNAIVSPWLNGQTEGQTTRLKLIKRQMYGRAKDLQVQGAGVEVEAVVFDFQDVAVVGKPIEQRGGHLGINAAVCSLRCLV